MVVFIFGIISMGIGIGYIHGSLFPKYTIDASYWLFTTDLNGILNPYRIVVE